MRIDLARLLAWALPAALLLLMACGDDDTADTGQDTGAHTGLFGEVCTRSSDCESNACIEVSTTRSVCSGACDPDAEETECPTAANWLCIEPNELDVSVCACQSDGDVEVCADGVDNDCDGRTDNCRECAGQLIGPDDIRHCGGCGRACTEGATCVNDDCVCPEGQSGETEDCVRDPSSPECKSADDCDDGVACTEEVCMRGRCVSTVVPARCAADEVCDLRRGGCVPGMPCANDSDCVDDDPCTTQIRCDPSTRVCLWVPLDGDFDGQPPRVCGGTDCDDDDDLTFAGAPERCDGVDNSCNGVIDSPLAADACGEGLECMAGACECTGGLEKCNDFCFDLDKDVRHCGACGQACAPGAVCQGGSCTCPDTLTQCTGGCFDLQSDPFNCGACGQTCQAGFVCEDGACVDYDECAAGEDSCSELEECVNVDGGWSCPCKAGWVTSADGCVDVDECARGADNCSGDASCTNTEGGFECACRAGFTGDGVTCEDVDECLVMDCGPNGTCSNTRGGFTCNCDPGYAPDGAGGCMLVNECQAGLLLPDQKWCGNACRNLLTDSLHCGDCNASCSGGICSGGACACTDASLTYCSGAGCVNLQSSTAHCGDCNDPCPSGAGCVQGNCVCPSNGVVCGNACVTLGTTVNCTSCGDSCPTGGSCNLAGVGCECPPTAPTVCNNACVNTLTNIAHCGDCGDPCPQGATSCAGGNCVCPAGQVECSDRCAILAEDEGHCGQCEKACDVVCASSTCRTATAVDTGNTYSCALLSDATVRCWGTDTGGVLGDGPATSAAQTTPVAVLGLSGVQSLALGPLHACALVSGGNLYCWGENGSYQTLSNTTVDQTSAVLSRSGVSLVALGWSHTCVQLASGAIECIGLDSQGQHGDGATVTASNVWSGPATQELSNVDKLVAGDSHTCALKGGVVYCWGDNAYGQIGNGVFTTDAQAPTQVVGLSGIDDITAGGNHTCALDGGTIYCWGANSSLELGLAGTSSRAFATAVPNITTAVALEAGAAHTCATLSGGELQCWGSRVDYRIGGTLNSGSTDVPLTVSDDGTLVQVSAGGYHTCALSDSGNVLCWGDGNSRARGGTFDTGTPTALTW